MTYDYHDYHDYYDYARAGRGMNYFYRGKDNEAADLQYKMFKACLPQLMDESSMCGDLTDKWVIFANGWLADYQGFDKGANACKWAVHLYREDDTAWVVARVNLADHDISPLALLGGAISPVEDINSQI